MRQLTSHGSGRLRYDPLDSFRLNAERQLVSDELEALIAAPVKVQAFIDARKRQREREREGERLREEERLAAKESFLERVDRKAAAAEEAWRASEACERLTSTFGFIPAVLNVPPKSGNTAIRLPIAPVMWQSDFYLHHIHGRPPGCRISNRTMTSELERMDRDVRFAEEAVRGWLAVLERAGFVDRVPSEYRRDRWPKYVVARSILTPEPH